MDRRSATKRQEREKNTAEKRGDREHLIELTDYSIWEIRRQIRAVTVVCAFKYHPKNSLIFFFYHIWPRVSAVGRSSWWLWRVREQPDHFPEHTEQFFIWYLFFKAISIFPPLRLYSAGSCLSNKKTIKFRRNEIIPSSYSNGKTKYEIKKKSHNKKMKPQRNTLDEIISFFC